MDSFGLTHIYTGEGKGKTTAAMGLILRALGRGASVLLVQFMKSSETGEMHSLERLPNVDILRSKERLGFSFRLDEEGKAKLKTVNDGLLKTALAEVAGYDMLVLDEAVCAYALGYLDRKMLLSFLKGKPRHIEVVLTGRGACTELISLADYVSEIQKVKHPFDKKVAARIGIEK